MQPTVAHKLSSVITVGRYRHSYSVRLYALYCYYIQCIGLGESTAISVSAVSVYPLTYLKMSNVQCMSPASVARYCFHDSAKITFRTELPLFFDILKFQFNTI